MPEIPAKYYIKKNMWKEQTVFNKWSWNKHEEMAYIYEKLFKNTFCSKLRHFEYVLQV